MADFDMWGPAQSGARLAQQDAQQFQLNNLAIQQGKQTLAMNQMKMLNAMAQQKQQAITQQVIQQDQGKSLYQIGSDLMLKGNVVQGLDMISKAAEVENRQSLATKNKAEESSYRAKSAAETISSFASMVSSSNSQDDYNRGVQTLEQATGQKLPENLRNATWSPEMKNNLSQLGTSWKDRAMVQIDRAKAAAEISNKASEERLHNAQQIKEMVQTKEIRTRTENLAKNGGTAGTRSAIPMSDVKAAEDMIRSDFPDALDDATTRNAAHYVASRAQTLLQKNKGLDRDTAIYQAYSEAKSSGEIQPNEKGVKVNRESSQFPGAPSIGTISQGYKYKGGDPADKNSWEKQ